MKTAPNISYSFDDIVFEGRHQAYGAYALRKAYPDHVKKATIYMFATVSLLLAFAYVGLELKPDQLPTRPETKVTEITSIVLPKVKSPVVENPTTIPPKAAGSAGSTRRLVGTRVVPDQAAITEVPESPEVLTTAEPGLTDVLGDPASSAGSGSETVPNNTGSNVIDNNSDIRDFVEQMPVFPGGLEKMYAFIRNNLRYPAEASRLGLEGTVIITFVINKTGEISDIQVIKELGGGTAEEAVRVIKKMKPWNPGMQNGQPVPVRFTLPLRFSLGS